MPTLNCGRLPASLRSLWPRLLGLLQRSTGINSDATKSYIEPHLVSCDVVLQIKSGIKITINRHSAMRAVENPVFQLESLVYRSTRTALFR